MKSTIEILQIFIYNRKEYIKYCIVKLISIIKYINRMLRYEELLNEILFSTNGRNYGIHI